MEKYCYSPHSHYKSRKFGWFSSRRLFFFGLIVVILSSVGLVRTMLENYRLNNWEQTLAKEIEAMNLKKTKLAENLNYVSSLNYHEKKAKEELNMQEPGEKVVFIQGIAESKTLDWSMEEKPTPTPLPPPWQQWYKLIFDKETTY